MNKIFWKLCIFSFALFFLVSCKKDKFYWTQVSTSDIEFYFSAQYGSISQVQEESSGETFFQYSLYYKDIQPKVVNNVYAKTLGYNNCGFEGKLKYQSGAIDYFGFIFNLNTDTNCFYALRFTKNGTLNVAYYDVSIKDFSELAEISNSQNSWIQDSVNLVKVQTLETGEIEIYINNALCYTIYSPVLSYGAVGIFEMLDENDRTNYSPSSPMISLYQINSLQKLSE